MKRYLLYTFLSLFSTCFVAHSYAQGGDSLWHGIKRVIHYKPDGDDFVLVNGKRRFNRALYGTHTAFRVETGDGPEFALYMPGMGGNFKFGLVSGDKSKWITMANNIKAIYRPGSMLYEVRDSMLGNGFIRLTVLTLADAEGMIIKASFDRVAAGIQLLWAFGGASGKKFNRDGDIGADPESSFYLQPEYCKDNSYKLLANGFTLSYGSGKVLSEEDRYGNKPAGNDMKVPVIEEKNGQKQLVGVVPPASTLLIADAKALGSPAELYQSKPSSTPVVTGMMKPVDGNEAYFLIINPTTPTAIAYNDLQAIFNRAEAARKEVAGRVKISTPDPYINTLGGALSIAADAIWEEPSYLHGAVAWRMRLNAWRGPYAADPLGWHDRARKHFSSYAASQVISPESGPVVADTALHLARQAEKMGTSVFSSGYISRNPNNNTIPHHYDMNLVFIDELLNHFNYTGDIDYVKQLWPLLQRHLAWEKRNFDADGDGLYDAYAAIWASDALEYSGGGVTHSSAYNYRANKSAAQIAKLIGEDPAPYQQEAAKILAAMNAKLWMPSKGWYAEYKDLLGLQRVHPSAGLWTIYHALDEGAADPFQAWQSLRYIDTHIPHIPVKTSGVTDKDLYVLSTTNWHPYEWSLNNVVLAESQHTALAYWQGGNADEAYKIWRSSLIESMYIGASPGGFQQLTFYDAVRGELYRDFADGIGMSARALVEGCFGVLPDALKDTLTIKPGWPLQWDYASLHIPDVAIDFKRTTGEDVYTIIPSFQKQMNLRLQIRAKAAGIKTVLLNGKPVAWKNFDNAISNPMIEIATGFQKTYLIKISWADKKIATPQLKSFYLQGSEFAVSLPGATIKKLYDPQSVFFDPAIKNNSFSGYMVTDTGCHTAFLQIAQGGLTWWEPLNIQVKKEVQIIAATSQPNQQLNFRVVNNSSSSRSGRVVVNSGPHSYITMLAVDLSSSKSVTVPAANLVPGTNSVIYQWGEHHQVKSQVINWNISAPAWTTEMIDISPYFNDKVTNIFKNQYLSPRPSVPTLQLPTQGIGEWTHPLITANIDDKGLRSIAGEKNQLALPQGFSFQTPSDSNKANIVFTSQWDNYPKQVLIPLLGKASHAYLLMAGSTNPMQSRITNGMVYINYTDGSSDSLALTNPETWWPIEQDYYNDGYAFNINAPRPVRIHLKTGKVITDAETALSNNKGKMIDGGAATVLDLPLSPNKTLKNLQLQTVANDVVIGLMSLTLVR